MSELSEIHEKEVEKLKLAQVEELKEKETLIISLNKEKKDLGTQLF